MPLELVLVPVQQLALVPVPALVLALPALELVLVPVQQLALELVLVPVREQMVPVLVLQQLPDRDRRLVSPLEPELVLELELGHQLRLCRLVELQLRGVSHRHLGVEDPIRNQGRTCSGPGFLLNMSGRQSPRTSYSVISTLRS